MKKKKLEEKYAPLILCNLKRAPLTLQAIEAKVNPDI